MKTDRKDIFEKRFKEYYPRLCSIAWGYIPEDEVCEDIVQEVFISIWDKGKDDLADPEFYAYVSRSVRNACISYLRKEKSNRTMPIDDLNMAKHNDDMADTDDLDSTAKKHPEDILEEILGILPERCREIFVMSKLRAMKYKEIALNLNISEKTVENQMGKALKMLRQYALKHTGYLVMIVVLFQILYNIL